MDLLALCTGQPWCAPHLNMIFTIFGLICSLILFASFGAKLTKTPKDDEVIGKIKDFWLKFLRLAPTVGLDPKTKGLLAELEAKKVEPVVEPVKTDG